MELSDNEEGYEVNDSGEFVQSGGTNPPMSSSDLQDSLDSPSGRRVVIHRSGSVTVTNSAGAQLSRIEGSASSEQKEMAAQYYDSQAPPPSQVALNATSRMSKKIQTQAGQLLKLQTELDAKTRYARLCEKRLLDFDPNHGFPVTQGMLGIVPPPFGSPWWPRYGRAARLADGVRNVAETAHRRTKEARRPEKRGGSDPPDGAPAREDDGCPSA